MRVDGEKIKNLSPFTRIIPYIMDKTYDAQNFVRQEIDLLPIKKYLALARAKNITISHLGIIIASYIRSLKAHPELNRFVINKKIYQRNYFSVSFVLMKSESESNNHQQTVIKVYFSLDDNLFEVCNKIDSAIKENSAIVHKNSTDILLDVITRLPFFLSFGVSSIKFLDKYGLLPRKFIEASPFHTSLFITNLLSIRTNYIYHHIYEFGTTCIFASIGNIEEKLSFENNAIIKKSYIPLGIVVDERICSGYEYARFFRCLKGYLADPQKLEIND